jgi:hypothetical protein
VGTALKLTHANSAAKVKRRNTLLQGLNEAPHPAVEARSAAVHPPAEAGEEEVQVVVARAVAGDQ